MNIFKVLASGRRSFQEETASAILAWLMNPAMEHGLGSVMLADFVRDLSECPECPGEFTRLPERLTPRLRNEDDGGPVCRCALEYNVGTGFIDIVFFIDQWVLSIENKIYPTSISDPQQLAKQYRGIKQLPQHQEMKVCMVFLVPIDEGADMLDPQIEEVVTNLDAAAGDFKRIVTWQKSGGDGTPSISELLSRILKKEATGRIDPIPEYTRHTLKALSAFITSGFAGYEYDRDLPSGGLNDATEHQLKVSDIERLVEGFVGVKAGVSGLLRMPDKEVSRHRFQYTSTDMTTKPNWMAVDDFKKLMEWRRGNHPDIAWAGAFPSVTLWKIAGDYGAKVFIGIKGGETALREMPPEVIREKQWRISRQRPNQQWIPGDTFVRILEERGVFQSESRGTR